MQDKTEFVLLSTEPQVQFAVCVRGGEQDTGQLILTSN